MSRRTFVDEKDRHPSRRTGPVLWNGPRRVTVLSRHPRTTIHNGAGRGSSTVGGLRYVRDSSDTGDRDVVLAVVPVILAVIGGDWLTRSIIRPIRELADVSVQLASGHLEARSRVHGPPEVRAVAAGLNHLAGRIHELLRQERESVADLSHQLRTPLTALRLEVDATPGAEAIASHVAILEDAVTGVIEQARHAGRPDVSVCDAVEVVAGRCEFWSVLAEDQRRRFRIDCLWLTTTTSKPATPAASRRLGAARPQSGCGRG